MNQLGLNWEFVEQHYPDYQRSDVICLSNDMARLLRICRA